MYSCVQGETVESQTAAGNVIKIVHKVGKYIQSFWKDYLVYYNYL